MFGSSLFGLRRRRSSRFHYCSSVVGDLSNSRRHNRSHSPDTSTRSSGITARTLLLPTSPPQPPPWPRCLTPILRQCKDYTSDAGAGSRWSAGGRSLGLSGLKFSDVGSLLSGKEEEEQDSESGKGIRKKFISGASLGIHDRKKDRNNREETQSSLGGRERNEIRIGALGWHTKDEESVFTQTRFDQCNISPVTIKALTSAGYTHMTWVQEAALPFCLDGRDALVKSKAGTGKSIAFLIPTIEAVVKAITSTINQRVPPILGLILCPTRELASQITAEANVLLRYHDNIGVVCLVGGTRFKVDQQRLESNPSQILVATPGRLLDHIENKTGFTTRLMGLKIIVLDEADHLLKMGFRSDVEKIIDCLPRQRQSLLFSATMPREVRRISQLVLKREHSIIDTVGFRAQETHTKVLQSYIAAPLENHFEIVYQLLKDHFTQLVDCKAIVFCTTAMVTALMNIFLRNMKINVREMHSRKPQLYRTRVSEEFRDSKRLVLVTSDVSARGMNYPDVTLVIQVGIPSDREHYIHRLGRTGREGKNGKGILLLAPWEEYFKDEIGDLPITKSVASVLDPETKLKVGESMQSIDIGVKEAAYHAWLGYYNSVSEIGRDKTMLVELANKFCTSIGLEKPPALFRKTVLKMGLKGIPGIRVSK